MHGQPSNELVQLNIPPHLIMLSLIFQFNNGVCILCDIILRMRIMKIRIKELTYGRSQFILQRLSLVTQLVRRCLWKI